MQKNIRFKIPKNALEKSAAKEVCRIAESGGKIGVACSGGADSVCALMWVAGVFSNNKKNVYVLHFNHRERAAADSDAEFVGAVAKALGANFILGKAATPPKKITEDSLRRLRLGFVAEQSAELGLSAVVQGHNSGDVAETLVMRLMRGAGAAGMSAPRPVSHFRGAVLVRPLLRLSKTDIKNLLRDAKIDWREDETNASADFLRNRLRAEIIPAIDSLCAGGFSSSALRSRAQFQEDSDFIEKVFEKALAETPGARVVLLVNNAGFGTFGDFADMPAADNANMVRLLMLAPVELTYRALPYMAAGSRILNVASVAAFMPQPGLATYSAAKRFVLDFSRALDAELGDVDIHVTALCPKFMRTGFLDHAGAGDVAANMAGLTGFEDVERVARLGLRAAREGRALCIPSADMRAFYVAAKLLPYPLILNLERALMGLGDMRERKRVP